MTFIFRNRTIFLDISKQNRGQKKVGRNEHIFKDMNKVVLATIDGKIEVTRPTKLFDPNDNS